MMRAGWIGGVMVLLLMSGGGAATAQSTADAYFHEAARQYVADEVQAARRTVERGLEAAPSDSRLLALRKKLEQGKRPDRRGKPDSSDTGSNEDSQSGDNSSSDESSKGGQEPSEEQSGAKQPGTQASPSSEQTGPPSNTSPSGDGSGRAGPRRSGQGGRPVDTLSRAQAERLLRALEGQERRLLRQLRPQSTKRKSVEKDW